MSETQFVTPSKSALLFNCEVCGKSYKTKKYFLKHINEHTPAPWGNNIDNENQQEVTESRASDDDTVIAFDSPLLEDGTLPEGYVWGEWTDDEEIETYFEIEDEEEEGRRGHEVQPEEPPRKKARKAALLHCQDCRASFNTVENYVKHRAGHGMKAACLRIPSIDAILQESPNMGKLVLEDIAATKLTEGPASKVKIIAENLLILADNDAMSPFFRVVCEGFCSFFSEQHSFLFPSQMAAAYYKNASIFLIDPSKRSFLINSLSNIVELDGNVQDMFLSNFLFKFSNKLLAFVIRTIRCGADEEDNLENRYAVTEQSTVSLEYKQTLHYIGGSNVKSVLRTGLKRSSNESLQRIISTIRETFLVGELASAPEPELMAWTREIDRGKLTNISANALDFFLQLGIEVKPLERLDGSLFTNDVLDKACNSPALLMRWDDLKGTLSEMESFKLLHALISHFCVTWRNGIINRRKTALALEKNAQKRGTGGVAFRAKLGGK